MPDPTADTTEEEMSSRRSFLANGATVTGGLALTPHAVGATEEPATRKELSLQSEDEESEDESQEATDLNEADITFLQEMISHHWGAVTMARLVPEHSDREPLVEMAEGMVSAQSDQISRMEAILQEADIEYQSDDVAESTEIPGMPSAEGMATLRTIEGHEFNLTFINLMTAHHRGAIILANRVLEEGQSEEIAEMAGNMITSQKAEIYTLYEWYLEWAESPNTAE